MFWDITTARPAIDVSRRELHLSNDSIRHMLTNNDNTFAAEGNDTQFDASTYPSGAAAWVDIARVANLAEAGFIVDELIGLDLHAQVHQADEFSAATDRWSVQYLIRVPEEFAATAADHIRQYLSEEPCGPTTLLQRLRESVQSMPQEQTTSWRPVVVIMLVGVTSFLLGHQYSEPAAPHRPAGMDLATALAKAGQPFSTESAANQPRYRLSFDRRQQSWTLASDRDGDGVFESTQRFTAAGAAR